TARGAERHARGTEPHDSDALNEVQSNHPLNHPYNQKRMSTASPPTPGDDVADDQRVVAHLDAALREWKQPGIPSAGWGTARRCAKSALYMFGVGDLLGAIDWGMLSDFWRPRLSARDET